MLCGRTSVSSLARRRVSARVACSSHGSATGVRCLHHLSKLSAPPLLHSLPPVTSTSTLAISRRAFARGRKKELGPIPEIKPQAYKKLYNAGANVLLLDVREPHEIEETKIERPKSDIGFIPWNSELSKYTVEDAEDIEAKLHKRFGNKENHLVCMCRSGARSMAAAELMRKCGWKRVYNLEGGILAWWENERKDEERKKEFARQRELAEAAAKKRKRRSNIKIISPRKETSEDSK